MESKYIPVAVVKKYKYILFPHYFPNTHIFKNAKGVKGKCYYFCPLYMSDSRIVTLFDWLDETTSMIQKKLDEPYLDSFALSLEALFYDDMPVVFTDDLRVYMTDMLQQMDLAPFSDDERQKAIQLIILKGMQKTTQQQHVITPEAIALFIGYLANKLTGHQQTVRLFDPVSGTGNLLFTVMDAIHKETQAYASEVDGTLLKISLLFANILKKEVEFFHQDSLRPFLLDPVDLVIADLPVGYYPDDVQAAQFDMAVRQGHTYAHHLLIEQSLTYTKAGGYAIFIIPESLFDSEQSEQLHMFIQKQAHVIGLIQLSETTFKSKENRKSVFILRKKGARTKDVKQPLLAQLPSFKNTAAMEDIMGQLNGWFEEADLDTT